MKSIEEIKKILTEHKKELSDQYGVNEIGIFGSYIKGKQKDASDIDVLIDFQKGIDLFSFIKLKNHLYDLLKIKIDLVMKKALKPNIGKNILKETIYL